MSSSSLTPSSVCAATSGGTAGVVFSALPSTSSVSVSAAASGGDTIWPHSSFSADSLDSSASSSAPASSSIGTSTANSSSMASSFSVLPSLTSSHRPFAVPSTYSKMSSSSLTPSSVWAADSGLVPLAGVGSAFACANCNALASFALRACTAASFISCADSVRAAELGSGSGSWPGPVEPGGK